MQNEDEVFFFEKLCEFVKDNISQWGMKLVFILN